MWNRSDSVGDQVASSAPPSTYATAKGEVREVMLSDGSRITLDTDSAVKVAFVAARRNLTLQKGRAFFAVKHDASRRFQSMLVLTKLWRSERNSMSGSIRSFPGRSGRRPRVGRFKKAVPSPSCLTQVSG